jgi:hypothetical protein
LNIGVSLSPFLQYKPQDCPVYDGGKYGVTRGPNCTGPGTGTGPTNSGPVVARPASADTETNTDRSELPGAVTTGSDNDTLRAALDREPSAADTLMLGPLVQSVRVQQNTGGEG